MTGRKPCSSDPNTSIAEETVEQYRVVTDSLAGLIAKHSLRVRDFILLSFLIDQGPMEIDQLVDVISLGRPLTLDCIDRLDKSGLVLQQTSPDGGDVVLISATDVGRDFISKIDSADEK